MQNTVTLLKRFCIFDFVERSCEKALGLLTKDIRWFGISDHGDVHSIDEAKTYLLSEIKSMPNPYCIEIVAEEDVPTSEFSGVAFLRIMVKNDNVTIPLRITAGSRMEDGEPKLCSMHFSVADADQRSDDYAPIIKHNEEIETEKRALVMSTMQALIQNISCGVVVSKANPVTGTYEIQYINEGFCQLFEDTEEALRIRYGSDLTVGVHPDDLSKAEQIIAALMGGAAKTEDTLRFVLQNGKTKWMHLDVRAVLHADGTALTYATYYDVTTQVQQEQQLRDIIHTVPGGVCLYRWDGKRLKSVIISEQFSEILGEDATSRMAEVENLEFAKVHPDDLLELQKAVVHAFAQVGRIEHTYRARNVKTNDYRWVYMQGVSVPQADGTQLAYVSYTDITQERLTAQCLRASERALDVATEQAGLWCWNYDPSNDRAYFNPRCIRDFDLPAILEQYPQAWLDKGFILPAYTGTYLDAIQKVKAGEPQAVFEAQVKLKDGSGHWAEFRFTNLPDEDGKQGIVVCTGRLIDYEKALLAKYELEQQKPSLGEKDLILHAVFNLDTGETLDYDFAANVKHLEEKFKTLRQATENVARFIIGEKEKKKFLAMNCASFLKEQVNRGINEHAIDYRRRMPDGRIIWVRNLFHLVCEPNTRDILLFEYCYNIHEQKMAEEVLRSATVFDYERIACVNFEIGKMLPYGYWDDASPVALIDYEATRRAYAIRSVVPEEQAEFLVNSDPKTVMDCAGEKEAYSFTTKICRADGTVGIVKTRFVPYDMENNIYIMSRTDVTQLLKEEETKSTMLRDALTVAQQANSAKSDFLASMSHDIRTPMNAIVGMCELALEDESDHVQIHESLKIIQSSSKLLLALINNILDMSRIESGTMILVDEPFSLTEQINETAKSYRFLTTQRHQNFALSIDIEHDACIGDIARIHSGIDNILSNAIQYTPNGGTISYRVSEVASGKPDIGLYRFEISDTGIGMSEEKQKRLFEPFYRGETHLTAKIEGTGLGLSIAKAIVDLKGGTISVESREGVGTTIVVELPLHFAKMEALPPEHHPEQPTIVYDLSDVHVLLCEDHPINQKVAQRMLEKCHAKVTVAANGQAGYEAFIQSKFGVFDVILMDIQMPIMNGYEATKAIRESGHPQAKAIPIVAITANAFAEDVQKSRRAGMNEHLAKPIVPTQLYESILHYAGKRAQYIATKTKVLFVDDVELNIAVLTLAIDEEYEVFIAHSGAEALQLLEQHPDIAAVITDIMMPVMDGIALIKKIRANARYQNMAILANTQYGDSAQEEYLLSLGADDFLYKPTTPVLVQSRLKSALRKYGM